MKLYFAYKAAKDFITLERKTEFTKDEIKSFFSKTEPRNFGMR
jgi:hypothetical protein